MRWLWLSPLLLLLVATYACAAEVEVVTITLIDYGVQFKCLAQNPGAYWYLRDYNDTWWATCKNPLTWSGSYSYRWGRFHFTLPTEVNGSKVAKIVDCTLEIRHDDDVKAFINGYLVLEKSGAATDRLQLDPKLLLRGEDNVLAMQVYNRYGNGALGAKLTCRVVLLNDTSVVTTTVVKTQGTPLVYVLIALGIALLGAALLIRTLMSRQLTL